MGEYDDCTNCTKAKVREIIHFEDERKKHCHGLDQNSNVGISYWTCLDEAILALRISLVFNAIKFESRSDFFNEFSGASAKKASSACYDEGLNLRVGPFGLYSLWGPHIWMAESDPKESYCKNLRNRIAKQTGSFIFLKIRYV